MADRATITFTYPGLDGNGNVIPVVQSVEINLDESADNPAAITVMRPIEGGTQKIEIGVDVTNVAPVFYEPGVIA